MTSLATTLNKLEIFMTCCLQTQAVLKVGTLSIFHSLVLCTLLFLDLCLFPVTPAHTFNEVYLLKYMY